MAPIDPEVPEADALEQAQALDEAGTGTDDLGADDLEALGPATAGVAGAAGVPKGSPLAAPRPATGLEVPEADALDQSREVPLEDDRR